MIISWITEDVKYCTSCKHFVPISMFGMHRYQDDKLNYRCKTCERTRQKQLYVNNKEHRLQQCKGYRDKNKEACKARNKRWAQTHSRQYWATNCIGTHSRYGIIINVSKLYLTDLAMKTNHCSICDRELDYSVGTKDGKTQSNSPTLDRINNEKHINYDNIWILCHECNSMKRTKTLLEFINYCQYVVDNKENILNKSNINKR